MANYQPLPPHVHHTTTRLTHQTAHTLLSTFLSTAENNAAYRPDSTLSERGPISSSSAGSGTNLTLHHLNRILQGIEGKRVGGAGDLEKYFSAEADSQKRKRRREDEAVDDEAGDGTSRQQASRKRRSSENVRTDPQNGPFILPEQSEAEPETPGRGWQDKGAYDAAQKYDMVDVMNGDRLPGANLEQPVNEREEEEMVGVEVEGTGAKIDLRPDNEGVRVIDKEERKRRKKERRKEEKRGKK